MSEPRLATVSERQLPPYGIPLSHPVLATRGMLDHKRLPYRYVELLAVAHPPSLWALGFRTPNDGGKRFCSRSRDG